MEKREEFQILKAPDARELQVTDGGYEIEKRNIRIVTSFLTTVTREGLLSSHPDDVRYLIRLLHGLDDSVQFSKDFPDGALDAATDGFRRGFQRPLRGGRSAFWRTETERINSKRNIFRNCTLLNAKIKLRNMLAGRYVRLSKENLSDTWKEIIDDFLSMTEGIPKESTPANDAE